MSPLQSFRRRLFNLFRARADRHRDVRSWARAAVEYRRAVTVDPRAWPIWVQLGHALKEAGDPRRARQAYLQALKIQPSTADTALHLGHLSKLAGDLDDARRWYARALAWPPGEVDAALELAALGVEGEALEALVAATEPTYSPEPARLDSVPVSAGGADHWARGDAARDAGDWGRAAAEYRQALNLDETAWPLWVQLGHALKETGDRHGARQAYERALAIAPDVSDTALQLGHVTKLLGDLDAARRWYARALIWAPGEADAAIELSRLGIEGAALEALVTATEPHYFATPAPGEPAGPPRIAWALPAPHAEAEAIAAWLTDIALAAAPAAVPLSWSPQDRQWRGGARDAPFDVIVLTPPPSGLEPLQLAACRTLAMRKGARIVVALPCAAPLLAPQRGERLADLLRGAAAILTFTAEDEAALLGRVDALGLQAPIVRLPLAPAPPRRNPVRGDASRDVDILLAGDEAAETDKAIAAHARLAKGRRLHVQAGGQSLSHAEMDALLSSARSLVAPAAFPGLEAWLSRACEAGVPVMASARGPAYRLFGHGLADYIDAGAAGDLTERWSRLGVGASEGEPDTPRWAQAIVDALGELQTWPSSLGRPPFVAFGDFRSLDGDGGDLAHCVGEGWAGFSREGARLDGPASLRLRLPPHRSPVRFMLLFGGAAAGGRLRVTARAGEASARATRALGSRTWGWAQVALTPPVGPHAEVILDLSPVGSVQTLTIAGFAAYPEREDRYWHELLDRAARGQAPSLWRATRRLAVAGAR